jgi:hypothetical protein
MPNRNGKQEFLRGAWRGVGYVVGSRGCGSIVVPYVHLANYLAQNFAPIWRMSHGGERPLRKPVACQNVTQYIFATCKDQQIESLLGCCRTERFSNANATRRVARHRELFPSGRFCQYREGVGFNG